MSLSHWNPDSAFAGFDDAFFRDHMAPSSLLGKPPSLTKFKNDTTVHASPRYEVTENEKQFRLAVDVPGVKPDCPTARPREGYTGTRWPRIAHAWRPQDH